MNHSVKALITVFILGLIAVASYYYFGTRQPNESNNSVADTSGWQTYTNAKYGYEFKYPKGGSVGSNDMQASADVSGSIYYGESDNVQNYNNLRFELVTDNTSKLAVKEYAEKIWQINKNNLNKAVNIEPSEIHEVNVAGTKAYQFTLIGGFTYTGNGDGYILSEQNTFIFVQNGQNIFRINYPSRSTVAVGIVSSLTFTK